MAAGYQELFLEQGSNFNTSITLDNSDGSAFDLTGYQVKSSMKKSYYSSTATAQFIVVISDPASGVLDISLPYANTANIPAGRYVYDVVIKDTANTVSRVLEGIVNVTPQVTVF